MEEIIYGITFFVYALFSIRTLLSWIGGDFDVDCDLDLGDIISFKGLTHFLMGSSGWLSARLFIAHTTMWYDYLIAVCVGIIFAVMLFQVYVLLSKLESKPTVISGIDLIGHTAKIDLQLGSNKGNYYYNILVNNGIGTIQQDAVSNNYYLVNESVTIKGYNGAQYII